MIRAYDEMYLDDAMRLNRNMRGFKSLRALYLFEEGPQFGARLGREWLR